ncbi:MAG: tetratricopeptide repeat protein [bacterium]
MSMTDMYEFEVQRFQDLLKENRAYAFDRYGWCMLYSLPVDQIQELKTELGWKPETALDHYNTGALLCRSSKITQGLKHLEQAQQMGLEMPELYYNLGLAYEKRSENDKATACYRKFIDVAEKEDPVRRSLQPDLDEVRVHLQEL